MGMEGENGRRRFFFMLLALAGVLLVGCSRGVPSASAAREDYNYTKPQVMLVVATERNRYEQAYTEDVWEVVLENGQTFESYLLEQVRNFLRDLKTMNLLADSQEIVLSNGEKERLNQAAERYYESLTQADLQYMGVTQEDVAFMYQEYYRANKAVGELTKEVNLEVSDSEAKVISVRQIVLASREEADLVHGKALEEGSDFVSIARENSMEEVVERQLGRGEEPQAIEEAAFALAVGEISPVVEADDVYYIFQCVKDYDMEATQERKAQLHEERKAWVFQQIYDQFQAEHEVLFSEEIWEEIHFSKEDRTDTDNFFALYQEEFGSQGY